MLSPPCRAVFAWSAAFVARGADFPYHEVMATPSGTFVRYSANLDLPRGRYERAIVLRDALIEAVDDPRKLPRGHYRTLRREFMQDPETADLLPTMVKESREPEEFCALLSEAAPRTELRRRLVWGEFTPLLDALNVKRAQIRAPLSDREKAELFDHSDGARVVVRSSSWTGTRTIRELCGVVVNLVPPAVAGIDALLAEQEQRLHNGPPEPLAADALSALRELRDALSELLVQAEKERPLDTAISGLQHALNRAFTLVRDTGELLVGGMPTLAASTVTGWGTFAICQLLAGLEGDASATMAAGAIAATVVQSGRISRRKVHSGSQK